MGSLGAVQLRINMHLDFSYHLGNTECMSKIVERRCIVIPENLK